MSNAISVIGAGSYGTALAMCLARNGVDTYLWGRSEAQVSLMTQHQENTQYLPGYSFPPGLTAHSDIQTTLAHSRDVLVVVPSHAFAETLSLIAPYLTASHRIVWATKGLEPKTGRLLHNVAADIVGPARPFAILSGPTFAKEIAAGLPTAISLATTDTEFGISISQKLHCEKSFRVYLNTDVIGVQLGGAVKNVIAIGAGLADGLGFGANARTALITRGLAEMSRLGCALNASPDTFTGMAGLGDLVLTCTDNQSRNRRFGLALGNGSDVANAIADIGQVVEGFRNTEEVHALSRSVGVEMPICEQIYQVLYEGKDVKLAAQALLSRAPKHE